MSTFIAGLALPVERLEVAKTGILGASLAAGLLGYRLLRTPAASASSGMSRSFR